MASVATPQWIEADWDAPAPVRALVTTRAGGCSASPWHALNLGLHVGDDPAHVVQNRAALKQALGLVEEPLWMEQVHGTDVVTIGMADEPVPKADAAISRIPGRAAVVMTADCLPVFFCDRAGTEVAVAHAGWRGLLDGILEQTINQMHAPATELLAWMGPAIGPDRFEVGQEVRDAFCEADAGAQVCFRDVSGQAGKYLADLYGLARQRLQRTGIVQTAGGGFCTFDDAGRFYSYRRDGVTGRMASLIYIKES